MSEDNFNHENVTETQTVEAVVEETVGNNGQNGQDGKGMGIASMVLGIISLVLCCIWYISIPCAIVAIILGAIQNKKCKVGMATAGIVCAIIGLVICLLWIVVIAGIIGVAGAAGLGEIMSTM